MEAVVDVAKVQLFMTALSEKVPDLHRVERLAAAFGPEPPLVGLASNGRS